jgi:excisionase family DNA binding protein
VIEQLEERMINTPYQFKSLASRVRGMHGALDADELSKLLGVAKVTILRRAKRGKIPSFRIGTMVRFDPQAISRWLLEQGVQSLSSPKRVR